MQVTTIDEARALVGRTFERDGLRRKFVRIEWCLAELSGFIVDLYWQRPGRKEYKHPAPLKSVNVWLSRATEITP